MHSKYIHETQSRPPQQSGFAMWFLLDHQGEKSLHYSKEMCVSVLETPLLDVQTSQPQGH